MYQILRTIGAYVLVFSAFFVLLWFLRVTCRVLLPSSVILLCMQVQDRLLQAQNSTNIFDISTALAPTSLN